MDPSARRGAVAAHAWRQSQGGGQPANCSAWQNARPTRANRPARPPRGLRRLIPNGNIISDVAGIIGLAIAGLW